MNNYGLNTLKELVGSELHVHFSITGSELKERVHRFIYELTGISVPFQVDSEIETGAFLIEIDFEELSDESCDVLSQTFSNPQEHYEFTRAVINQMFHENTFIYLSEESEDELYDGEAKGLEYYFTISTTLPKGLITQPKADETFAAVSWSVEDIKASAVRQDMDEEMVTEDFIQSVLDSPRFEKSIQECMIERGWEVIDGVVYDVKSDLNLEVAM